MPHIGRGYPYLNRSRVIAAEVDWPYWAGTEYQWAAGGWTNNLGGVPLTGRGILPTSWVQGERTITYTGQIGSYLGLPLTLDLVLAVDGTGVHNSANYVLQYNGVLCQRSTATNSAGLGWFDLAWSFFDVALGPASNVLQQFLGFNWNMQTVVWSETPVPPYTSPF